MRKSATTPGAQNRMRPDLDPYIEKGYIPLGFYAKDLAGDTSVSHALEYYMADAALSLLADSLGHGDDARLFRARSFGYKNYYSTEVGHVPSDTTTVTFLTPFDPQAGREFRTRPRLPRGSAWNYTFYVPHDVAGLAELMGGRRRFIDKLQMVFDQGLYDPANEPDIAYPYLFSYFRARSGVRSARCGVCWTGTLRQPPTASRATTTRAPCLRGLSSRCWASIPTARANHTIH